MKHLLLILALAAFPLAAQTPKFSVGVGSGGGSSTAGYYSSVYTSQTTATITGATHGFTTTPCNLNIKTWDSSSPRAMLAPSAITVDSTTCDVVVTFGSSTTFYVSIDGGAGPTGATGAAGSTGSTGAAGAGYTATSTTSLVTAGSGSKAFTTQSGLAYTVGARIRATSAGTSEWMEGVVTAYSSTTLTATMDLNSGTGTHTDWNINLAGERGATGATGATGSTGATGPAGPSGPGSGDVLGPGTNTDLYVPRWAGANTKTLSDGLPVAQAATASTLAQRNASGEMIAVNTVATGKTPMATDTAVQLSQLPGTVTLTIASGTSALGTSAISANTCASVVTTSATGTASTDVITWTPNASLSAVTGYGKASTDGLIIYPYPTTNNVNFEVCNATASSITPSAVTLNWRVAR